jgi:hypothetical protein
MIRRVAIWSVAVLVAVSGILAILTYTYFWRSPGYYLEVTAAPGEDRVISLRDYDDSHPVPYVIRADHLLVFGAAHTQDPHDAQFPVMERSWREFKPTVALVEGRLGFLAPGLMDPVRTYGETGRVNALAKSAGVPTYTWEVPWERTAAEAAAKYPREQVALYFVLRPYFSQARQGKPDSPEKFVAEYLHRAAIPVLGGAIRSVADIDRIWRRDFAGQPDWRDVSDGRPLAGYLNEIAIEVDTARNRHLVRVVHALLGKGERVFVICGASHAAQIEPALR